MDSKECAKIIAIARLSGANGTAKEIIELYEKHYKSALSELQENSAPAKVEAFKRPF